MICDNVTTIAGNIRRAAEKSGRNPKDITLVCVAKNRSPEEIKEAVRCGISDIGENRVQEAIAKYKTLHPRNLLRKFHPLTLHPIKWHMIGHLQTNKAGDAVKIFDLIHSLDSLRLANEVNSRAARINKVQDLLIEVNTSGEETKFGVAPDDLMNLVRDIINLKNIRLSGLMTIAPIVEDTESARPYFRGLRQLQGGLNNFLSTIGYKPLTVLSMGMTRDYEAAVEEGATMVRIGTAIFEG